MIVANLQCVCRILSDARGRLSLRDLRDMARVVCYVTNTTIHPPYPTIRPHLTRTPHLTSPHLTSLNDRLSDKTRCMESLHASGAIIRERVHWSVACLRPIACHRSSLCATRALTRAAESAEHGPASCGAGGARSNPPTAASSGGTAWNHTRCNHRRVHVCCCCCARSVCRCLCCGRGRCGWKGAAQRACDPERRPRVGRCRVQLLQRHG